MYIVCPWKLSAVSPFKTHVQMTLKVYTYLPHNFGNEERQGILYLAPFHELGNEEFIKYKLSYFSSLLFLELLSFSASSFSVLEGARFIGLRVERVVNPGTNIFFFSTVINDITATGIIYQCHTSNTVYHIVHFQRHH